MNCRSDAKIIKKVANSQINISEGSDSEAGIKVEVEGNLITNHMFDRTLGELKLGIKVYDDKLQ